MKHHGTRTALIRGTCTLIAAAGLFLLQPFASAEEAGEAPAAAHESADTDIGSDDFGDEYGDDVDADDAVGADDEWGYDSSEFSAFEHDDLAEDDYGHYDSDFYYETEDEDWDAWYEEDDELWRDEGDRDGFWNW